MTLPLNVEGVADNNHRSNRLLEESRMSEQRFYRRISFHTEAKLNISDNSYPCELIDLALQGALFKSELELPLAVNQQCDISITLPSSNLTLEFNGELIHQRGAFYGFLFVSEDAATMGHLRRLLELNIGDGDEVDREFLHWLKK
ncbi:PilZ domain-containing protein [Malonomonas rubra DSM 5091]|uniref:PilZ domain-containing protein n=1 Tax=Malonomonas rubra DSM 5091 TaxID=1122189 RepID=A0A1M6K213_MALRU|nr:PilZ domain-containing protein [Malonomonas rubra]SHJ52967.1 PilZ domain-containing protein [Malonomonas rubra DSM 5091]